MKMQSLLLLCLALFVFNCSDSEDSDGAQNRPDGEIQLLFDLAVPQNAISFTSTSNFFEIPCDFGEIDVFTATNSGNDTFEVLDINIPNDAILIGDNFSLSDTFSNGLGGDLIASASLRVNGINYVAVEGDFSNILLEESREQDGVLVFSCTAILTMQDVSNTGPEEQFVRVRIDVIEVGKGSDSTC